MSKTWCGLVMVPLLLASVALAQKTTEMNVSADVEIGQKPGTTETLSVTSTGPGGETRTVTREVRTADESASGERDAGAVAPDTTPRKARVVVVPAIFAQDVRSKLERELNEKFGMADASVMENPGYTSFLLSALVNSRKVDVLEREDVRSAIKELDFGESEYADLAKAVKVGGMVNADYVVIPEIRYLGIIETEKQIPYVGQTTKRLKGTLSTSVRTVDVKTSRVVSSRMGEVWATNSLRRAEDSPASPVRGIVDRLYGDSAIVEAAAIVDTAYPIKVVALGEGTVVLNRGEGAIREGEELNVYQTGEVMVDPDTGENLGYNEARVGKVRVVKVDQKVCTAEVQDGAAAIRKGFICRRDVKAAKPMAAEEPAPSLE